MLLALRRLILGHADGSSAERARTHTGSANRVTLYRQMIAADPAEGFDLARFAAAGGVTRFQVIRDLCGQDNWRTIYIRIPT
jgi:hypothetical protein